MIEFKKQQHSKQTKETTAAVTAYSVVRDEVERIDFLNVEREDHGLSDCLGNYKTEWTFLFLKSLYLRMEMQEFSFNMYTSTSKNDFYFDLSKLFNSSKRYRKLYNS